MNNEVGPKRKRFYDSRKWREFIAVEKQNRRNDRGFIQCEHCGKEILKAYQAIGHHVIELDEDNVSDANISLNPDNIEILCIQCHNNHHDRFNNHMKQNVIIVHGAPFAGKMDYVKEAMSGNDIVVEIDRIYEMITMDGLHNKNLNVSSLVFDVRNLLYDKIRHRRGKWSTAYIVATLPTIAERQRIKKELNADEFVHIDTPAEECAGNLLKVNNVDHKQLSNYILDYFDRYQEDIL